jgi:hypothetical protein
MQRMIPKVAFARAGTCKRCNNLLPLTPVFGDRSWPHLYCSTSCLDAVKRELRAIGIALSRLPGTGGSL